MTDFFTSDLHLGDNNVALGLRGFATTAEHDPEIPAGMTEEWGVEHAGKVIYIDFYGTEDEEAGHAR